MTTCSFLEWPLAASDMTAWHVRFFAAPEPVNPESISGGPPKGTIRGDETIILVLRPSRWFVLLYPSQWILGVIILAVMASIAFAALQGLNLASTWSFGLIWLCAIAIMVALIVWSVIERRFRVYVLTTDRILTCSGVIRRSM